jgi:hypothetical protein
METQKANETEFIIITYGYGVQADFSSLRLGGFKAGKLEG